MCRKRQPKPLGFIPSIAEIARLLAKRLITDIGCWEWQGTIQKGDGQYGKVRLRGRYVYVHRVVYAFFREAIPAGKVVGHTCNNSRCCNPDHLRAITDADNVAERNVRIAAERRRDDIPF